MYNKAGSYTVTLIVGNKVNSTAKKTYYIKVLDKVLPPVAEFTASSSGRSPLTVAFMDKSTNNPTSWFWSFGDMSTSTAQNPVHKYAKAGKYVASLTVGNLAGYSTKIQFIQI